MRAISAPILVLLGLLVLSPPLAAKEPGGVQKLCGWIENPTPANWWLDDRNGQWIISVQGDYEAEGIDKLPDFGEKNWVATNGSHGYGCACLKARVDKDKRRVTTIEDVSVEALDVCRADKHLKEPAP
jgi:hypothetical protein